VRYTFCHFGSYNLSHSPTASGKYFVEVFVGNRLYSESFEPLIDFLAFLVQTLKVKNIKLINI